MSQYITDADVEMADEIVFRASLFGRGVSPEGYLQLLERVSRRRAESEQ